MSYHGLVPLIKGFIDKVVPRDQAPSVLEIGIDRGVTLVPMAVFLARTRSAFNLVGVDVKVQEQVALMLKLIDLNPQQQVFCIQDNSLSILPKMVDQGMKFDVVFLDGDHNYHTVSQELQHIEKLVGPGGIIVVDDYDGRWSDKDLFYSDREEYRDVKCATPRVDTQKHGVKPAVDEWLERNLSWMTVKPVPGEPVVLVKKDAGPDGVL